MEVLTKIVDTIDEIINFDPIADELEREYEHANQRKRGMEVLEKYPFPGVQIEISDSKKNGKTKTLTKQK